jgi:hypothetical protein
VLPPVGPSDTLPMNRAAESWRLLLNVMLAAKYTQNPMTVAQAVDYVNDSAVITNVPGGEVRFRLKFIGDGNARLKPQ